MFLNFETLLTLATLLTGMIWLFDSLFFAKKRLIKQGFLKAQGASALDYIAKVYGGITLPDEVKMPRIIEYARSFFPILLFVLLLRTMGYEPYRIPSGSDKPTLLIGDFILVDKHIYGWRLPISNEVMHVNQTPKRGDIVIFRFSSVDPSKDLIKRVVGLPGDHVSYINKVVYVNGEKATQTLVGETIDTDGNGMKQPVEIRRENLLGISHLIYQRPSGPVQDIDVVVPTASYFVMGDNRDDSYDSRYWGFVSQQDLKGKAIAVWMSWNGWGDGLKQVIRWGRLGKKIH